MPPDLLAAMLDHGISVASINYRFTDTARLPAPVHDAARAVQFLRNKSVEWKLDPLRFAAYGISAGATTTLWLACRIQEQPEDTPEPESFLIDILNPVG